jgi:CRISPR-associated protein Cmr2
LKSKARSRNNTELSSELKKNSPSHYPPMSNSFYRRKLYALLNNSTACEQLNCWGEEREIIEQWWHQHKPLIEDIASSSDRVNLDYELTSETVTIKHPISSQERELNPSGETEIDIAPIKTETNPQKVFWWFWRFYPALRVKQQPDTLLEPQHTILPDCPIHSYRATVSALAGTCYPQTEKFEYPYLLLFTFSPVQEFIKASRKFLDFWAGSYLLHYLSAKLCWRIANRYGPDAIITPSLWGQEIIDALLLKQEPDFNTAFENISSDGKNPKTRFEDKKNISLATAGFPNTLAILVPASETETLGENLSTWLTEEWNEIAEKVREGNPDAGVEKLRLGIRERTIAFLQNESNREALLTEFGGNTEENRHDLEKWQKLDCWQWRSLWNAQIHYTWQPYWVAVPLGDPDTPLQIEEAKQDYTFDAEWIATQETVAQTRAPQPPPTEAEKTIYQTLNVGTWWGSIQARLGQAVQALKNTRVWRIPAAPGYRSTLSGQFSALHPGMKYCHQYREGQGLPAESMRLFWRLMAEVYPGLFNGCEQLNALELTKRMAWVYGGVAESLGINLRNLEPRLNQNSDDELDYNQLIRFPNLSSIAAARFAYRDCIEQSGRLKAYWQILNGWVKKEEKKRLEKEKQKQNHAPSPLRRERFAARTRRPFQIPKTDRAMNARGEPGQDYNGVMFSSKWLADDLGLNRNDTNLLRGLVEEAHQEAQLGDGSPADWWAIVLGDGDGMGKYVSGQKLLPYEKYLVETEAHRFIQRHRYPTLSALEYDRKRDEFIAQFGNANGENSSTLLKTRKRMGPATHVGLNRALLDFSNRLVPYLTQQRFCGRVIYSGGDDVMAVLPLEDLPEYLLCVQAAWCGGRDPYGDPDVIFTDSGGYWHPQAQREDFGGLPNRPLFTMGEGATMSFGVVVAHKSVPLPTVLKALWEAESDRAKKMLGSPTNYPDKNGLCFRVLYGSGNQLEALLKGELLPQWWQWLNLPNPENRQQLSSLLYRLAEELPRHAALTEGYHLVAKAADAIARRRDGKDKIEYTTEQLCQWLENWEDWANAAQNRAATLENQALGTTIPDLARLLRFSAFWLDKMQQRSSWHNPSTDNS